MKEPGTTDELLLQRLPDESDREAWREFVAIYRPLVVRVGRQLGLQHIDAEGLAQDVLLKVGRKVGQWQPDQSPGSFRRWLGRIARNAALDTLRCSRSDAARGGSSVAIRLARVSPKDDPSARLLKTELERQAFRWAVERIRDEFREATWSAFWETMVEGRPCTDVAAELGKSIGAVYIARTRVTQRLKEEVELFDWEAVPYE